MFNKFLFFLSLLFLGHGMFAQEISCDDSIYLSEVMVSSSRSALYNEGSKRIEIDSITLASHKTSNLGELLSLQSELNISSYGSSQTQTSISLRNAGASRTLVTWGGFPLNSSTMGMTDLSLVPSSGFNSICVNYGASGSLYGSGAFGGSIDLEYTPEYDSIAHAEYTVGIGCFGTIEQNIMFAKGSSKIQYKGSVFYNKSDGDFPYFDSIEYANTRRINNDYYNIGTIHYLYAKPVKGLEIGAGAWYQVKFNNLPGIAGQNGTFEETQKDSSLKIFANVSYKFNKHSLKFKIAYFDDYQHYTKKLSPTDSAYSINSHIYNKPLYIDFNYRIFLLHNLNFDIGLLYTREQSFVSEFPNYYTEHIAAGLFAMKYRLGPWTSNISGRYELHSEFDAQKTLGIGSQIYLFNRRVLLRSQFANKYRRPTFDDKYWPQWGNKDLTTEHGFTTDGGILISLLNSQKQILTYDCSAYYLMLNDMIVWLPAGSDWYPFNFVKVSNTGIDQTLSYTYKSKKKFSFSNGISVNIADSRLRAVDSILVIEINDSTLYFKAPSIGKSLYYTPKFKLGYSINTTFRAFSLNAGVHYTSKIQYKEGQYLDDYVLVNLGLSYQKKIKKTNVFAKFDIYNLLNTKYEIRKSYLTPGINYKLTIQISI